MLIKIVHTRRSVSAWHRLALPSGPQDCNIRNDSQLLLFPVRTDVQSFISCFCDYTMYVNNVMQLIVDFVLQGEASFSMSCYSRRFFKILLNKQNKWVRWIMSVLTMFQNVIVEYKTERTVDQGRPTANSIIFNPNLILSGFLFRLIVFQYNLKRRALCAISDSWIVPLCAHVKATNLAWKKYYSIHGLTWVNYFFIS